MLEASTCDGLRPMCRLFQQWTGINTVIFYSPQARPARFRTPRNMPPAPL